ncbi:hypothetical protein BJV78DRAFT_1219027 [Lactifluus subvellereus]|nr:hypothetical protein BJV78DRAFT_1219027 [Lactifluus subvellereus]
MNLLDLNDIEPGPVAGGSATMSAAPVADKALPALGPLVANDNVGSADDDFADFQAAPSSPLATATTTTTSLAAAPVVAAAKPNLMDLLASTASAPSSTTYKSAQPTQSPSFGAFNSLLTPSSSQPRPNSTPATTLAYAATPVMSPTSTQSAMKSPVSAGPTPSAAASSTKSGGGGFDDLWTMSLGSAAASKPAGPAGGKSIRDLEKEKAQAGIWGAQSQMRPLAGGFGSFAKPAAPSGGGGTASAGPDDLLL